MRLFTFTTTSSYPYVGEGVDWENGKATYRYKIGPNASWEAPYSGSLSDLDFQIGGLPGYELTYLDED